MSSIAIDTNVFEHMLNPAENHDAHIDRLLAVLIQLRYRLLVDSTRKIGNEYQQMILPIVRNMDETRPHLPLLRYWMSPEIRHEVTLDQMDSLMQSIRSVIFERSENADRAFVYVVCREDSTLITNDQMHILSRRGILLKRTKRFRGRNAEIQSSRDAEDQFCTIGGA